MHVRGRTLLVRSRLARALAGWAFPALGLLRSRARTIYSWRRRQASQRFLEENPVILGGVIELTDKPRQGEITAVRSGSGRDEIRQN